MTVVCVEKKMFKKSIFSCLAIASINLVSISAQAADERYGTLLFDKTGSMQAKRADGSIRCDFGKKLLLVSLANAINKSDIEGRKLIEFLNLKTFDSPGNLTSLSNGFVDVRGWSSTFGQGKAFYDAIEAKISRPDYCNGSSTALGDALCDTIDELRAQPTTARSRLGLVTDAYDNASRRCNGPTYVTTHIVPRLIITPPVTMNITILTPPGNVSARSANKLADLESVQLNSTSKMLSSNALSVEIQQLTSAAINSGGGVKIIPDDKSCTVNCDPLSQESAFTDPVVAPSESSSLEGPSTSTSGNYSLHWNHVPRGITYNLEISEDNMNWDPLNSSGFSYSTNNQPNGIWYYRVTACNAAGCGPASTTRTVVVDAPEISLPIPAAPSFVRLVSMRVVAWGSVSDAAYYELQSFGSAGWEIYYTGSSAGTWYTGPSTFRVRACNLNEECSNWVNN
jgi:hypothetical protein